MNTVILDIPLLGTSAYHRENLSALDRIVSDSPARLIIKLLGPGGLAPEAILAYHDLLGTLTAATQIITISYSNLIGADLALFVVGSPRDIRPNAWCFVYSSPTWAFEPARNEDDSGVVATVDHHSGPAVPFDWRHHFFDYEKCLRLISEHVQLNDILDRRLEVPDLKENLLIDSGEIDALLLRQFSRGDKTARKNMEKPLKSRRKTDDHRSRSV